MAGRQSSSANPSGNLDNTVELNESTLTEIVRRVYDSVQSVSEERPSPENRSTNASVEDELAQRFNSLPRRGSEQRPQLPKADIRTFTNTRPRFNPQVNYGHSGVTRGKGKGKVKTTKSTKAKEAVNIRKELILLPYPTYTQVPRYEHKRKLQELGLIVDGFPLDKSWNENQLRLKIGGAFVQKLVDEQGEFVAFEYVKSIGQNICPLNLYANKEPSGENIYSMCKQGPIYIRACTMLKVWALDEMLESDGASETGMEDEATSSQISSSRSQFSGIKRSKQSTLSVSEKRKCVHFNAEERLTSGSQSPENDVAGDEITIDCDVIGTSNSTSSPTVSQAGNKPSDKTACDLDEIYATLLFDEINSDVLDDDPLVLKDIVETNADDIDDNIEESITLKEVLTDLGKATSYDQVSMFNLSRNHIWEGTKRALNRKSFSPENKLSVKFTDDIGRSEGAVDLGGPAREFFTLITEWLVNSRLFFGETTTKFLSLNAICLEEREYFMTGQIFAMSLVHGGPGANCLSSACYDAVINATGTLNLSATLDDIPDVELRASLGKLLQASVVDDARRIIDDEKLDTVFDMAGTFQMIRSKADVEKISTSNRYDSTVYLQIGAFRRRFK
ncbi:uncharacterized protein LOC114531834 [Dendronephthya gigantea]|uniref:uncharacterized protein LOC114531834 n=1 Tax=Dendronephthya gigantea TaxID=151771 RepID=UPI00106C9331|nr:uncharacterized protein LOC114531834 [Dendronephthya gigantea]